MRRLYLVGAAILILSGCQKEPVVTVAPAVEDPMLVRADATLRRQLTIESVGKKPLSETLRIPGRVAVDSQRETRVGAPVTARVISTLVAVGDHVKRGQVMAELHSTELSAAQLSYLKALSQVELQRRAVERAGQLLAADVIGSAELQRRQSEAEQANAELSAAAEQLKVLGMSPGSIADLAKTRSIRPITGVVAQRDGVVIERKVAEGQVVQPGELLFSIADLSQVWLVAEVPEQQADRVRVGEQVVAEIPALDRKVEGRLVSVADIVNPETRTVTVRMAVDNPERALKPAMLANMLVQGKPREMLAVPAAAVVRQENRDHVFVEAGTDGFRLRPIVIGAAVNGHRRIDSGLSLGERIVTNGAFHLNNQRQRKELD